MRALTVRQPWAQLIALGIKRIETRSWKTALRGPLVIHAGKSIDHYATQGFDSVWHQHGFCFADAHRFPPGAIVASCNLVDVVPITTEEQFRRDRDRDPVVVVTGSALSLMFGGRRLHRDYAVDFLNITDQLPYGNFSTENEHEKHRWAWLLEDVKPTTERCPACLAYKRTKLDRADPNCVVCEGKGACDPIPARGKQGLWTWRP